MKQCSFADVGELSTRLNLLLPVTHPEEGGAGSVQADCCSDSSQCVYLEKLLGTWQIRLPLICTRIRIRGDMLVKN
jgi:hypothetical protein